MHTRAKGREAEDTAAEFLLDKGYTIITRRYQTGHGEIDLIALDGETLVFIELKNRCIGGFAEQSIGPKKIDALTRAARKYMRDTRSQREFRYDVIAMDTEGTRHHENTFEWQDFPAHAPNTREPD